MASLFIAMFGFIEVNNVATLKVQTEKSKTSDKIKKKKESKDVTIKNHNTVDGTECLWHDSSAIKWAHEWTLTFCSRAVHRPCQTLISRVWPTIQSGQMTASL